MSICLAPRCPFKWKLFNSVLCRCKKQVLQQESHVYLWTNPEPLTPFPSRERLIHVPRNSVFEHLLGIAFVILLAVYMTQKLRTRTTSKESTTGLQLDLQPLQESEEGDSTAPQPLQESKKEHNIQVPLQPIEEPQEEHNTESRDSFRNIPDTSMPRPISSSLLTTLAHERPSENKKTVRFEDTDEKVRSCQPSDLPMEPLESFRSKSDDLVPCILFPRPDRARSETRVISSRLPPVARRSSSGSVAQGPTPTSIYFSDVTFKWKQGGRQVYLTGSFFNWDSRVPMVLDSKTQEHTVTLTLHNGRHEYKFIVDREWRLAPDQLTCDNRISTLNHYVFV